MDAKSITCHARHSAIVMVGRIVFNPFTTTLEVIQSAKEETETGDNDNNIPDDSDDGNGLDNDDGGVPDGPIWTFG